MMKYNSNSVRRALSNTVMDPKQRWDASEGGSAVRRDDVRPRALMYFMLKSVLMNGTAPYRGYQSLEGG